MGQDSVRTIRSAAKVSTPNVWMTRTRSPICSTWSTPADQVSPRRMTSPGLRSLAGLVVGIGLRLLRGVEGRPGRRCRGGVELSSSTPRSAPVPGFEPHGVEFFGHLQEVDAAAAGELPSDLAQPGAGLLVPLGAAAGDDLAIDQFISGGMGVGGERAGVGARGESEPHAVEVALRL